MSPCLNKQKKKKKKKTEKEGEKEGRKSEEGKHRKGETDKGRER